MEGTYVLALSSSFCRTVFSRKSVHASMALVRKERSKKASLLDNIVSFRLTAVRAAASFLGVALDGALMSAPIVSRMKKYLNRTASEETS